MSIVLACLSLLPPASSGSALPIRWAMKSVSHTTCMCLSFGQLFSPSYNVAQYLTSKLKSVTVLYCDDD